MSSPPPSAQPHTLNLLDVLSETAGIITAHTRHFLALFILILLPFSLYDTIFPFLFPLYSYIYFDFPCKNQLICNLLYIFGMFILSLFASASIINSTFHGFSGSPVKIVSSLKSVLFSFFPLLATIICAESVILIIFISFGISTFCMFRVLTFFEVDMAYNSSAFLIFASFISCLLFCVLVYLQIMWCLVHVVVVVESKWGFEALQRSAYLVKGMRRVALHMLILFGVLVGLFSIMYSVLLPSVDRSSSEWVSWTFVDQTIVHASFVTVLMVYSVAVNTVLFMYCKVSHGELLDLDYVDEFSREYVSLPFEDDGKVTNVV